VSSDAPYLYYCDNETVNGIELPFVPTAPAGGGVLVTDMSSNFLSRPIDVSRFGLIWAGAQKNCGIPGVTIAIVRSDLLQRPGLPRPNVLDYKVVAENKSVYNTPDTFAIYVTGLMFRWIEAHGGVQEMAARAKAKSELLYGFLAQHSEFFTLLVDPPYRSRMNVVWRCRTPAMDAELVKSAYAAGLHGLAGHRSVGGLRASLYNAISLEDVQHLVRFLDDFERAQTSKK